MTRCWRCPNCRRVAAGFAGPNLPCTNPPKPVKAGIKSGREVKAATSFDPLTWTPAFVTVRNVPIVMSGVEYRLATGPATFTPEDIMDFVTSQDDPAIVPPRLKIGHESVLSNTEDANGVLKNSDDGVPALGKFINIRFDEENIMAVGDLVTVKWLAEIMPLAYPNRSIEGFQEALTNSGHVWGLVVHAVALLGVVWPGVSTLDDLPLLYGETAPDGLEVVNENGEEVDVNRFVAARREGAPVAAAVNVEDVRRQYYDSLTAEQMWWWIRAIYIDPNELIVQDDDSGDLFRVPFSVNGDTATFEDPQQVVIQYVNARAGSQERVALLASTGQQVAVFASRAESRPEPNAQGGNMTPDQIRALRARLGLSEAQLPDNATAAQINAALGVSAEGQTPQNPPVPPNEGGAPTGDPAEPGTEEPGTDGGDPPEEGENEHNDGSGNEPVPPTNAAAGLPPGMIAVPATEWARVQAGATAALSQAETAEEQRREDTIRAALHDGRIRPADVTSYRNMHAAAASRPMFYQLLTQPVESGGLAAGLVPTHERGELPQGDATTAADGTTAGASYDESWLTAAERSRIEKVSAGNYEPPAVVMDGNYNGRNGRGA